MASEKKSWQFGPGEYSCRCHGKRVISASSKPLKLKLAGHILQGETRLRTEGFCSAPLRSRDIRDKVRNGILTLFRDQLYFSATKQRRTKSFVRTFIISQTIPLPSYSFNGLNCTSKSSIIDLKPVTPTTILLHLGHPRFIKTGHDFSFFDIYRQNICPLTCQNHRNSPNNTLQAANVKYYIISYMDAPAYHLVTKKMNFNFIIFRPK